MNTAWIIKQYHIQNMFQKRNNTVLQMANIVRDIEALITQLG